MEMERPLYFDAEIVWQPIPGSIMLLVGNHPPHRIRNDIRYRPCVPTFLRADWWTAAIPLKATQNNLLGLQNVAHFDGINRP